MNIKLALSTATALGLLMGAAWAGDNNKLFITQDGVDNTADIHQSGTSTVDSAGNDIGLSGAPVVQDGNRNYLRYTNAGHNAGSDNDIVKLRQDGNDNWFEVRDSNGATHTNINDVLQDGNFNQMDVSRAGEQYSTVDTVLMDGNSNTVYVKQGPIYRTGLGYGPAGGHNTISLIKIVGNNNGVPSVTGGPFYGPGINIQQTGSATVGGSYNNIDEVSIEGSNNSGNAFSWHNVVSIWQEGSYNGRTASTARLKGSNGNAMRIRQVGDWNNFSVQQGISVHSTGNYATVDQQGSHNNASATQYGSGNQLIVNQTADGNRSTTNFNGNDNGVGNLGGAAGDLAGLVGSPLVQGTVLQDSTGGVSGNLVNYDVYGSRNLFAFAQLGGHNTISGTVGTAAHDSNDNQVAVLQQGNSNTSSFSQTGGMNNLAVSQ